VPLVKLDAPNSAFEYEQPWDLVDYTTFSERFPHLLVQKELLITKQVEVFAKPKGFGKTFLASKMTGHKVDLPSMTKVKTFKKWRDWVLMAIRHCCETRMYDVGVGETDDEIGSFIERLQPTRVIVDNWSCPLLVAHIGGYSDQAHDFYRLLFPHRLTAKIQFVIMTQLHLDVAGTIISGQDGSLLICNIKAS
jgi:hypothetical protein